MVAPVERVAKWLMPPSTPTPSPVAGSASSAVSQAMCAYQPSALRTMAQVFGLPARGRAAQLRPAPLFDSLGRPPARFAPLPRCG